MSEYPLPMPTQEYMQNRDWLHDNIDALAKDYNDQWVAVHDCRVIAFGPGLTAVHAAAERIAPKYDIAYFLVDDGSRIWTPLD